jgi:hypothetical protein
MEGLLLHKLDWKKEIFSSDLLVKDETVPILEMNLEDAWRPVLRIRIHRIHMFLGLQDPDPLVRGMDPDPDPALDPDPDLLASCQKCKNNLDSYYFVTLFYFLSLKNDVNVVLVGSFENSL